MIVYERIIYAAMYNCMEYLLGRDVKLTQEQYEKYMREYVVLLSESMLCINPSKCTMHKISNIHAEYNIAINDGYVLSPDDTEERCEELGIEYVPIELSIKLNKSVEYDFADFLVASGPILARMFDSEIFDDIYENIFSDSQLAVKYVAILYTSLTTYQAIMAMYKLMKIVNKDYDYKLIENKVSFTLLATGIWNDIVNDFCQIVIKDNDSGDITEFKIIPNIYLLKDGTPVITDCAIYETNVE